MTIFIILKISMLKNLKLVDMSRIIVGPYASMVLSDFGVEVIKVQSKDGDPTRQWGPPWHQGTSAYFHSVNRNKKSIALDLKELSHREVLYRMVSQCDAVVQNFIPGTTQKLGIDYDSLRKYNQNLVYCSISGYGDVGPMKNSPCFDNIIQAEAGFMHLTGTPHSEPFKMGFAITDVLTGLYASNAILAGLLRRQQTGKGTHLKTSLLECAVASLINQGSNHLNGGLDPMRMGNHHPNIVPYGLYPTQDGGVVICVGTPQQYERLLKGLEIEDFELFKTNELRVKNRLQFDQHLKARLSRLKGSDVVRILRQHQVPCGRVNSLKDCFSSELVQCLSMVQETDGIKYVRSPIRSDCNEAENIKSSKPPKLNEQGIQILKGLNFSEQEIQTIFSSVD